MTTPPRPRCSPALLFGARWRIMLIARALEEKPAALRHVMQLSPAAAVCVVQGAFGAAKAGEKGGKGKDKPAEIMMTMKVSKPPSRSSLGPSTPGAGVAPESPMVGAHGAAGSGAYGEGINEGQWGSAHMNMSHGSAGVGQQHMGFGHNPAFDQSNGFAPYYAPQHQNGWNTGGEANPVLSNIGQQQVPEQDQEIGLVTKLFTMIFPGLSSSAAQQVSIEGKAALRDS